MPAEELIDQVVREADMLIRKLDRKQKLKSETLKR